MKRTQDAAMARQFTATRELAIYALLGAFCDAIMVTFNILKGMPRNEG